MLICSIAASGAWNSISPAVPFRVVAGIVVPEERMAMIAARLDAIAAGADPEARSVAWMTALVRDGSVRAVAGIADTLALHPPPGEPAGADPEALALFGLTGRFQDLLEASSRQAGLLRGIVIAADRGPGDPAVAAAAGMGGPRRYRNILGGVLRELGATPLTDAAGMLADLLAERAAGRGVDAFEAVAPLFRGEDGDAGRGIACMPARGWSGPEIGVFS
ncbi:MAG TPA: hypothetical protein VMP03_07640 [Methylomirabilota bacterium]|nr:hypothetical protein [Methylomirabilota bacterium]